MSRKYSLYFFRVILCCGWLLLVNGTNAQIFTSTWVNNLTQLDKEKQIEVLAQTLLKDTFKYHKDYLYHSSFSTSSKLAYSPLIIVNDKNVYLLNGMDNACIDNFVSTFFSSKYLKDFDVLPIEEARKIFGNAGKNGVINLKVKKHNKLKKCDCKLSASN